jgi:hypothetical protein
VPKNAKGWPKSWFQSNGIRGRFVVTPKVTRLVTQALDPNCGPKAATCEYPAQRFCHPLERRPTGLMVQTYRRLTGTPAEAHVLRS